MIPNSRNQSCTLGQGNELRKSNNRANPGLGKNARVLHVTNTIVLYLESRQNQVTNF